MQIQQITDTNGEKIAILPWAEYERLQNGINMNSEHFQDVIDAKTAQAIQQRIAKNNEELIPDEVVCRIFVNRENRIRVYREWRGYSVKQLAEKIGVSAGYLSNVERGVRDGGISLYQKLSQQLDIEIQFLLPSSE